MINPSPTSRPGDEAGTTLLDCPLDHEGDKTARLLEALWRGDGDYVECMGCGLRSRMYPNALEALTAWNRRAGAQEGQDTDWICVSDRMPNEDVWVQVAKGNIVEIGKYWREHSYANPPEYLYDCWRTEPGNIEGDPTHWRSLPDPPKEDER